MAHYDLAVVGTGSGNSVLDVRFADWNVALIERGVFGGTCLNVGCIPTKMFVHTADIASTPAAANRFGVHETLHGVDWPGVRDRIFHRIDPIADGGRQYRQQHPDNRNVTVYRGHARFTGHKQLTVGCPDASRSDGFRDEVVTADQIVLAAGSRPTAPNVEGLSDIDYDTSDTIMRMNELPSRMVILGGGFIAAELAHVFSSFGVRVTIVARSERLLRAEETDISAWFTELAHRQWDVRLNSKVLRARETSSELIQLDLEGPNGAEIVEAETLLVATGRRPNTDHLHVEATGLSTTEEGRLIADAYQQTTVQGIWALGDISSPWQQKHVANHEQRVVQHNLLHPESPTVADHRFVPHAVFTSPQIASVGLTEQQARDSGTRYVVATHDYADIAYGWAMEDTTGFAKLLADPATGQLLGAHIIGPQAPTLIQPLIQAMSFGLLPTDMARGQYWIHPAMPELIENALLKLPLEV